MIQFDKLYFGVVEDCKNDPHRNGRVKVRIFGIHTEDKSSIPTKDLHWCEVLSSINSASISGVGLSPVGLVNGSKVALINKDSYLQEFIVIGTINTFDTVFLDKSVGFNDPDGIYPKQGYINSVNIRARGLWENEPYTLSEMESNINNNLMKTVVSGSNGKSNITTTTDSTSPLLTDVNWMQIAINELGTSEENNPERIREYHNSVGLHASNDVPWCSSFVNWCFQQVNIHGSGSGLAKSFLRWGKSVGTHDIPQGAVAVLQGTRGPSSGHVAFVYQDLGDKFIAVGGNQSSSDGKNFDTGGMVSKTTYAKSRLLDCRFPVDNDLNKSLAKE